MVIAIVAILAAMAMPAYNNYVNRGTIKSVQAELTALSLNFENFYQRRLAYPAADITSTANMEAAFDSWGTDYGDKFSFTSDGDTTRYTINATGTNGGTENCIVSMDNAGNKTITDAGVSGGPVCPYVGDWL